MTDAPSGATVAPVPPRFHRWWLDALHLVALSSIAVAWPLFDLLSKNSTFFAAHEMTGRAIFLYALGLLLVPPLVATAIVLAVRVVSSRVAGWLQALFVGGFGASIICVPLTHRVISISGLETLLYPIVTVLVALAYARSDVARRLVTILTPAPLVFLVLFLRFSPVSAYFSSESTIRATDTSGKPIVMLLLDEMTLPSILDKGGDIDAKRFPNFARLADRSTWYRNATTNANQTHHAMPAVFTGDYPIRGNVPPIQSRYPNNLFTWLRGSYEFHADEWVTRLCPTDACRQRLVSYAAVKHVAADTALVYLRLAAPPAIARRLPQIGEQWGGFFANRLTALQRIKQIPRVARPIMKPLLLRLADDDLGSVEVRRADAFTRSIDKPTRPTFWFLHVGLPHVPWNLLPDARRYDREGPPGVSAAGAYLTRAASDEGLQRYLVQVEATDRVLGSLIDRLEDEGMWDDTLFVVQADHGVVFEPGKRPRELIGTEDEILPIPLFIHYPGQRDGRIDDGRAELIDVAPTIADALGSRLPWHVDGTSLRDHDRPNRPRRVWAFGEEVKGFAYGEGAFDPFVRRIRALFGPERAKDDLFAWGPHRRLVGERLDELDIAGSVRTGLRIDDVARYASVSTDGPWLPARVTGTLSNPDTKWQWLAVAVNGRIAGLGRPFVPLTKGSVGFYAILASPRFFEQGRNEITILGLADDGTVSRLR